MNTCEIWERLYENPNDEEAQKVALELGLRPLCSHIDRCKKCYDMFGLNQDSIDIFYIMKMAKPLLKLLSIKTSMKITPEISRQFYEELVNEFGEKVDLVPYKVEKP